MAGSMGGTGHHDVDPGKGHSVDVVCRPGTDQGRGRGRGWGRGFGRDRREGSHGSVGMGYSGVDRFQECEQSPRVWE